MTKQITFFSRLRWLVKFFSFLSLRGRRRSIVSLLLFGKFLAAILDVLVFLLFACLLITLARYSITRGAAFFMFGSVLCGFIIGASVTESLRSRFLFPLSLMFFGFLAACLTSLGWKEFVRDTPERIQEGVFLFLLIVAILLLFWRLRASRQKM